MSHLCDGCQDTAASAESGTEQEGAGAPPRGLGVHLRVFVNNYLAEVSVKVQVKPSWSGHTGTHSGKPRGGRARRGSPAAPPLGCHAAGHDSIRPRLWGTPASTPLPAGPRGASRSSCVPLGAVPACTTCASVGLRRACFLLLLTPGHLILPGKIVTSSSLSAGTADSRACMSTSCGSIQQAPPAPQASRPGAQVCLGPLPPPGQPPQGGEWL